MLPTCVWSSSPNSYLSRNSGEENDPAHTPLSSSIAEIHDNGGSLDISKVGFQFQNLQIKTNWNWIPILANSNGVTSDVENLVVVGLWQMKVCKNRGHLKSFYT